MLKLFICVTYSLYLYANQSYYYHYKYHGIGNVHQASPVYGLIIRNNYCALYNYSGHLKYFGICVRK